MVGMSVSFGQADYQTPHGGPPFDGWKKGFGFGKAGGPGCYVQNPANPEQLRHTPAGDRCYANSLFWRTKWELGQASSFGIGERPDYGAANRGWSVSPDNYGDVSRKLSNAKASCARPSISLHKKFPSMEEKYRDNSWPQCGPGPSRYNTATTTGESGFMGKAKIPSYSCGVRSCIDNDLLAASRRPGPAEYTTRIPVGRNSKIKHGTLYDISMHGKIVIKEMGDISPGPAKYIVKSKIDECGFDAKISNVKVPRFRPPPKREGSRPVLWDTKVLARSDSSPAHL